MKLKLLLAAFILLFSVNRNLHALGGCTYLVSVHQPTQGPSVWFASITCTNGYNHDPNHLWQRGYYDIEVTICPNDRVTVCVDACESATNNDVLQMHAFPPYGPDHYYYANSTQCSRRTVFLIDTICTNTNATMTATPIDETMCCETPPNPQ